MRWVVNALHGRAGHLDTNSKVNVKLPSHHRLPKNNKWFGLTVVYQQFWRAVIGLNAEIEQTGLDRKQVIQVEILIVPHFVKARSEFSNALSYL